jgi:hypothetical protein
MTVLVLRPAQRVLHRPPGLQSERLVQSVEVVDF